MKRLRWTIIGLLGLSLATALNASDRVIRDVSISRPAFNAAAGESVVLSAAFADSGRATAAVLDRDGVRVRTLAQKDVMAGKRADWTWDGRDEAGLVVPDEAYSFRIDWSDGRKSSTYLPANIAAPMLTLTPKYYDRRGGTLAYDLPGACRVHIQAGTTPRVSTDSLEGAVMKTVANREPRAAGAVAEHWDGYDESGTIFVPDLPNFVVAIAATPLPENSVITFGNRERRFLDVVALRKGQPEITAKPSGHEHHAGLQALDDMSPELRLEAVGAQWSASDRAWIAGDSVQLRYSPAGPAASRFVRQPGTIETYVNGERVSRTKSGSEAATSTVAGKLLHPGFNVITVNWESAWGAVAASSLRVLVPLKQPASSTESGQ